MHYTELNSLISNKNGEVLRTAEIKLKVTYVITTQKTEFGDEIYYPIAINPETGNIITQNELLGNKGISAYDLKSVKAFPSNKGGMSISMDKAFEVSFSNDSKTFIPLDPYVKVSKKKDNYFSFVVGDIPNKEEVVAVKNKVTDDMVKPEVLNHSTLVCNDTLVIEAPIKEVNTSLHTNNPTSNSSNNYVETRETELTDNIMKEVNEELNLYEIKTLKNKSFTNKQLALRNIVADKLSTLDYSVRIEEPLSNYYNFPYFANVSSETRLTFHAFLQCIGKDMDLTFLQEWMYANNIDNFIDSYIINPMIIYEGKIINKIDFINMLLKAYKKSYFFIPKDITDIENNFSEETIEFYKDLVKDINPDLVYYLGDVLKDNKAAKQNIDYLNNLYISKREQEIKYFIDLLYFSYFDDMRKQTEHRFNDYLTYNLKQEYESASVYHKFNLDLTKSNVDENGELIMSDIPDNEEVKNDSKAEVITEGFEDFNEDDWDPIVVSEEELNSMFGISPVNTSHEIKKEQPKDVISKNEELLNNTVAGRMANDEDNLIDVDEVNHDLKQILDVANSISISDNSFDDIEDDVYSKEDYINSITLDSLSKQLDTVIDVDFEDEEEDDSDEDSDDNNDDNGGGNVPSNPNSPILPNSGNNTNWIDNLDTSNHYTNPDVASKIRESLFDIDSGNYNFCPTELITYYGRQRNHSLFISDDFDYSLCPTPKKCLITQNQVNSYWESSKKMVRLDPPPDVCEKLFFVIYGDDDCEENPNIKTGLERAMEYAQKRYDEIHGEYVRAYENLPPTMKDYVFYNDDGSENEKAIMDQVEYDLLNSYQPHESEIISLEELYKQNANDVILKQFSDTAIWDVDYRHLSPEDRAKVKKEDIICSNNPRLFIFSLPEDHILNPYYRDKYDYDYGIKSRAGQQKDREESIARRKENWEKKRRDWENKKKGRN